jgi:hypothetical protein
MSSTRKPEGVRKVADVEEAASAAMDRSRRALALRRFSSCGVLVLWMIYGMVDLRFGESLLELAERLLVVLDRFLEEE